MPKVLVDADASPVKNEVYRVAKRYGIKVILVANSSIVVPREEWAELVIVGGQLDAADDWIVHHIEQNDIVITGDIPLAASCLKKGAQVLSPVGIIFTSKSIGNALATRDLKTHLRDIGINTVGPAGFSKKDRSRFLQSLDRLVQNIVKDK